MIASSLILVASVVLWAAGQNVPDFGFEAEGQENCSRLAMLQKTVNSRRIEQAHDSFNESSTQSAKADIVEEVKTLEAQVGELQAENARLKDEVGMDVTRWSWKNVGTELGKKRGIIIYITLNALLVVTCIVGFREAAKMYYEHWQKVDRCARRQKAFDLMKHLHDTGHGQGQ